MNMAYVTHRTLKTSMSNVIPKSGRVKVSLKVEDERWKRRIGKWDPDSRTFTEVRLMFLGTLIHEITSYLHSNYPYKIIGLSGDVCEQLPQIHLLLN